MINADGTHDAEEFTITLTPKEIVLFQNGLLRHRATVPHQHEYHPEGIRCAFVSIKDHHLNLNRVSPDTRLEPVQVLSTCGVRFAPFFANHFQAGAEKSDAPASPSKEPDTYWQWQDKEGSVEVKRTVLQLMHVCFE